MNCDSCKSERVLEVGGKSSDCNNWTYRGVEGNGYLPHVPNVCGGDYYDLSVCLDCGKVQGKFPVECEELDNGGPAEKARQYFLDNFGNSPAKLYALGLVNPIDLKDAQGHFFCSHLDRWDRDVYGFLVGLESDTSDFTYVFIDPQWNLDMVKRKHYAWPHPDHCELTEIVR